MDANAQFCTKCGVSKNKVKKYCAHCGETVTEEQDVCTKCGVALSNIKSNSNTSNSLEDNRHTFYLIAFILNWVAFGLFTLLTGGLGIIAAAWVVPMTLALKKAEGNNKKNMTLAVCTLIFVSVISGILMLVAGGEDD